MVFEMSNIYLERWEKAKKKAREAMQRKNRKAARTSSCECGAQVAKTPHANWCPLFKI